MTVNMIPEIVVTRVDIVDGKLLILGADKSTYGSNFAKNQQSYEFIISESDFEKIKSAVDAEKDKKP